MSKPRELEHPTDEMHQSLGKAEAVLLLLTTNYEGTKANGSFMCHDWTIYLAIYDALQLVQAMGAAVKAQ